MVGLFGFQCSAGVKAFLASKVDPSEKLLESGEQVSSTKAGSGRKWCQPRWPQGS